MTFEYKLMSISALPSFILYPLSFILPLFLVGCSKQSVPEKQKVSVAIYAREERLENGKLVRWPLYRAVMPEGWVRMPDEENLRDSTKANATFLIDKDVLVTLHSFPYPAVEEHIPCEVQVERWLTQLTPTHYQVMPTSFSGFAGLFVTGENERTKLLAWSLQLDIRHRQKLFELARTADEMAFFRQMSSDCTLKVVGPVDKVEKHKEEICSFAKSLRIQTIL